jgi:8-oxo-dGTP pyrophosphatase MutT (NUDIX family)
MKEDHYPKLSFLRSKLNINSKTDSKNLGSLNPSKVARNVWEYYEGRQESPNPTKYLIETQDQEYKVRSNLSVRQDGKSFPEYDSLKMVNRNFSEYDERIIESIGIDTEKTWNGEVADVRLNGKNWAVGKTDYYSTYSIVKMLSIEIERSGENSLRDYLFGTTSDFKNPKRPVPNSSSGVIVANRGDDDLVLIIGRRSDDTDMNNGMLSVFPSGKCEYDDLKKGLEKTVEREFKEEIFSDKTKGKMFYDKHINTEHIVTGWNLRTGGLNFGHALFIDSRVSYDVLNEISEHNDEIETIIEIPINDTSMIAESFNLDNMSGYAVSVVLETLIKIDNSSSYPDLDYKIRRL